MNYLDEAQKLLHKSNCLRRKYAAIIVSPSDTILSYGWNESDIGCRVCAREGKEHNSGDYSECHSVHAEQIALLGVELSELHGARLYLVCNKDEHPEPCPICRRLMAYCGVELAGELSK